MTDPFTAAWEEAEASKPPEVLVYSTLELQHPAFVDVDTGPFVIRCVTGVTEDLQLTLEDGADPDGGQEVTFKAVMFRAERPKFEEGKTPECKITVDNVARTLMPYLEDAVSMRADLITIYREWRSDDLGAPCYGPVKFNIKQVSCTKTGVEGMARIDNLANRKFPNKIYTLSEYPGLQNG